MSWVLVCVLLCGSMCLQACASNIFLGPSEDQYSIMNGPVDLWRDLSLPTLGTAQKYLLVAIPSAPQNLDRRHAIRESWGKYLTSAQNIPSLIATSVDIRFFVANIPDPRLEREVEREAAESGDMVRLDSFDDGYYNLTRKTLGMAEFAYSQGYQNLFKCDDDTFLRLDLILRYLLTRDTTRLYLGHMKRDVVPYPDPTHKWYMGDQFMEERYPVYMAGPAYLLGLNAIKALATTPHPIIYRLEDVAVGIWLRDEHLVLEDMPVDIYKRACHTTAFVENSVDAEEQILLWDAVTATGTHCPPNWTSRVCMERPCMCNPLPEGVESCN